MATSGVITYNDTAIQIVQDAIEALGVYGIGDQLSDADKSSAFRHLNRMVKAWQPYMHWWKEIEVVLFLQKGEYLYYFGSTVHASIAYGSTTLSADEAAAQTVLSITSSSGMSIDDYIGIELDTGYREWTTIKSIPDSTSVEINSALSSAASEGNSIFYYTTKLPFPFDIKQVIRRDLTPIDVPMNFLSTQEYLNQPNKEDEAIPVSYSYRRQLNDIPFWVWPTPVDVKHNLILKITRKIEDFVSNPNTPDFPQEWLEALVWNLALRMAFPFRKANDQSFQELKGIAEQTLQLALAFDSEPGSIYFQPDAIGRY